MEGAERAWKEIRPIRRLLQELRQKGEGVGDREKGFHKRQIFRKHLLDPSSLVPKRIHTC